MPGWRCSADEGLVNNTLTNLGIISEPLRLINTPGAVIGGLIYGYLVFMILPVYGALERLDQSVIEAGKDLYGTPLQTFLHVTLPQTKQGILAGAVLCFLPSVGDFVSAQLLGGPGHLHGRQPDPGSVLRRQQLAVRRGPDGGDDALPLGLDGLLPALRRARRARAPYDTRRGSRIKCPRRSRRQGVRAGAEEVAG